MDRYVEMRKYLNKRDSGIEIGPFHSPIAPKSEGYNTLVIDIFTQEQLKTYAKSIPDLNDDAIERIESVDIIGTAANIADLVENYTQNKKYEYIISSHNFEHIPNPIKFFQGCGKILSNKGYLSMAIPDKRVCFDYFRPLTSTASIIEAHFQNRSQPTEAQIFEQNSMRSVYRDRDKNLLGFSLDMDSKNIYPEKILWLHSKNG